MSGPPSAFAERRGGAVPVTRRGRAAATLRGPRAAAFLAPIDTMGESARQEAMARLTGNDRRARSHPRNA